MDKSTLSILDWLECLSDSLHEFNPQHAFIGIWVLSDAIEFMGKILGGGKPGRNFEKALKTFSSFSNYKNISDELYHNLRCGLTHAMRPDGGILLKQKGENIIGKADEQTIITFESLLRDFDSAIGEISKNKEIYSKFFDDYINVVACEQNDSTTAATITKIIGK